MCGSEPLSGLMYSYYCTLYKFLDFGCKLWLPTIQNTKIVSKLLMDLSRQQFLGQVVNLELLLCIGLDSENVELFLCPILTQGPMDDQRIEWSYHDECGFGQLQVSCTSIESFEEENL